MSDAKAVADRLVKVKRLNALLTPVKDLRKSLVAQEAAARPTGVLYGMPVAVKDNICTLEFTTSCGSRILEGYRSPYDATAVAKLQAAGALIAGKTNCDEFAMGSSTEHSAYGRVIHPLDKTRVPGGSSGGSAALVGAGGARRARIGDGRLGAATGVVLRRRRHQTHVRPRVPLRARRVRVVARSDRCVRTQRARRRARGVGHQRP